MMDRVSKMMMMTKMTVINMDHSERTLEAEWSTHGCEAYLYCFSSDSAIPSCNTMNINSGEVSPEHNFLNGRKRLMM